MPCNDTVENTSYERLIATVHQQWETHGAAAMSARQISAIAATPVSSIYHHFGSLEHLFLVTQETCLTEAARWCERQLSQFEGLPCMPSAFAGFFAQIIDAWCNEQRQLAFAWRECQLLAQQGAFFQDAAKRWGLLWEDFWRESCGRFALGDGTVAVLRIFENESFLHMIRWRRLVDRAALDDTARTLAAWLHAEPVPAAPWREFARDEAMRSMPALPDRDATATQVIEAAAKVIDKDGVGSLTHRAVAECAGLTLGTVSHKFRTKSALLEAAFEGLYRSNVEQMRPNAPAHSPSLDDVTEDMATLIRHRATSRGSDELFVATARDASLAQFGAQLRYLRGRTSRTTLAALLNDAQPVSITEAALLSGFLTSLLRAHADTQHAQVGALLKADLAMLLGYISSAHSQGSRDMQQPAGSLLRAGD